MSDSIRRELVFPQSRQEVWCALTDPGSLAEWMFPNDFEAMVGRRFTFRVPPNPQVRFEGMLVEGEVLVCDPPRELSYSWIGGDVRTRVSYRLEVHDDGTRVFFEQSGFERDQARKGAEHGWNRMHGLLAELLSRRSKT